MSSWNSALKVVALGQRLVDPRVAEHTAALQQAGLVASAGAFVVAVDARTVLGSGRSLREFLVLVETGLQRLHLRRAMVWPA
jgi:hypothetical protein